MLTGEPACNHHFLPAFRQPSGGQVKLLYNVQCQQQKLRAPCSTVSLALAPVASCTVAANFLPAYVGKRDAPLIVTTSANGKFSFGLQATGVAPQVALLPGVINTVAGKWHRRLYRRWRLRYDCKFQDSARCNPGPSLPGICTSLIPAIIGYARSMFLAISAPLQVLELVDSTATGYRLRLRKSTAPCRSCSILPGKPLHLRVQAARLSARLMSTAQSSAAQLCWKARRIRRFTTAMAVQPQVPCWALLRRPQPTSAGNFYIADRNNNRIRKVDASGIITTTTPERALRTFGGDGEPGNKCPAKRSIWNCSG